ncbi:MAG: hypothetical protein EOO16_04490 [Chitinophagaceae bacterium]|nr:MAG: hypothetical protein EOO16_04490 [Chitinophagaceae bacterium]
MPAFFVSSLPAALLLCGAALCVNPAQPFRTLNDGDTGTRGDAPAGNTIATRFPPPAGFRRVPAAAGSFGEYLRQLPLRPEGAAVHYFDGRRKPKNVHAAVVNIDVGSRDLQQCADAVMRLRAEWLYARGRKSEISFRLTDGRPASYAEWMKGRRIRVRGNNSSWYDGAAPGDSYASFRQYLDMVFTYAGTLSLAKELRPQAVSAIAIGDVFIRGGSPGHAVIVADVVENDRGERRFLLAQSYMPAQEIHILKNESSADGSAWYSNRLSGWLETPEWNFRAGELKTW